MIQRIQTVFLLLSSVGFFGLFAVPFATSSIAVPQLFNDMVYNIHDSLILLLLCVFGGLASLGAVFLYQNRELQLKLTYVVTVFAILLPLLAMLLVFNEGTASNQMASIDDKAGIYLPVLSIICSILAARGIRKDENTVKSMDRLR